MTASSVNSPLFLTNAEDLVARLAKVEGAEARGLAAEGGALVAALRSWVSRRPDDATRVATIQRLLDLNRRAMDLLVRSGARVTPSEDDDGGRSSAPPSHSYRRPA